MMMEPSSMGLVPLKEEARELIYSLSACEDARSWLSAAWKRTLTRT
jgi:hypothetical protein